MFADWVDESRIMYLELNKNPSDFLIDYLRENKEMIDWYTICLNNNPNIIPFIDECITEDISILEKIWWSDLIRNNIDADILIKKYNINIAKNIENYKFLNVEMIIKYRDDEFVKNLIHLNDLGKIYNKTIVNYTKTYICFYPIKNEFKYADINLTEKIKFKSGNYISSPYVLSELWMSIFENENEKSIEIIKDLYYNKNYNKYELPTSFSITDYIIYLARNNNPEAFDILTDYVLKNPEFTQRKINNTFLSDICKNTCYRVGSFLELLIERDIIKKSNLEWHNLLKNSGFVDFIEKFIDFSKKNCGVNIDEDFELSTTNKKINFNFWSIKLSFAFQYILENPNASYLIEKLINEYPELIEELDWRLL